MTATRLTPAVRCNTFGCTDIGKTRTTNEDQFLIAYLERRMDIPQSSVDLAAMEQGDAECSNDGLLLVVADGVGDDGGGRKASALAVRALHDHLIEHVPWNIGAGGVSRSAFVEQLQAAVEECHDRVQGEATEGQQLATTLTVACVFWPDLYLVHVGDSRCYRLRNEKLEQLTRDQTIAQEFVDKGILTGQEADLSRFKHVLWNAIGAQPAGARPQVERHRLEPGDRLLLCTDGVTGSVTDQQLLSATQQATTPTDACAELIHIANKCGGLDNATAVAAFFQPRATASVCASDAGPAPRRSAARPLVPNNQSQAFTRAPQAPVRERQPQGSAPATCDS